MLVAGYDETGKYRNDKGTMEIDLSVYPKAKKYLESHKHELHNDSKRKWFARPRELNWFTRIKIITPNLSSTNNFSLDIGDNGQFFFLDHDCYGILLKSNKKEEYEYILAILNSKLMEFFIKQISPMFSGGYYKYHTQYLEKIPIIFSEEQKSVIVPLVEECLRLNKQLTNSQNNESSQQLLKERIMSIEKRIDEIIYQLYEINESEKIIIDKKLAQS